MKRHYRVLFLLALFGVAVGIAAGLLAQEALAVAGCLVIPVLCYLLALIIDFVQRLR